MRTMFNMRIDLARWVELVGVGYWAWFGVPYQPGRFMVRAPYSETPLDEWLRINYSD